MDFQRQQLKRTFQNESETWKNEAWMYKTKKKTNKRKQHGANTNNNM